MTSNDYLNIVECCNNASFANQRTFAYGGRNYSTEFKYILALIGKDYGYNARIADKFIIIKPKQS